MAMAQVESLAKGIAPPQKKLYFDYTSEKTLG